MRKFLMGLLGSIILIVMIGCSPTATEEPLSALEAEPQAAVDALEAVTVEPTIVPTAVPVVEEENFEEEIVEEIEAVEEVAEAEVEDEAATSELAVESEAVETEEVVVESASESTSAGIALEDQALMIDFNPFLTTTFNLDVPLPTDALNLPVLTTDSSQSRASDASSLAQDRGCAPPEVQSAS
ncbi:MAG: hypothetical protein AAF633_27875, partial [Chloroflexota bacterium]